MARQGGLGRGLAALLPSVVVPGETTQSGQEEDGSSSLRDADEGEASQMTFGTDLVAELAGNESGLTVIYRALDDLVERCELDDAAVVIEEPGLGRQVFRAGRRPISSSEEELLAAPTGLYTSPEITVKDFDPAALISLCVLALRLEVLRYDAWHDPLTGLYDRRSFDRLLEMAVSRSIRYGWPFTLVIIDLDHLKDINDKGGHAAGDVALRTLSERFRRVLRFGDNAARIGGDEFALILPDTEPDEVPTLIERVWSSAPYTVPSFSFGAAQCPREAKDYDELSRLADERLYAAKEQRA